MRLFFVTKITIKMIVKSNKNEYNVGMKKKKMLLHTCCAPCSTAVIDTLKNDYDLTLFYYNPNIYPKEEYDHRLSEVKRYVKEENLKIKIIDGTYDDHDKLYAIYKGHEKDKEGGVRCRICFALRLDKTAKFAKDHGFDIFATTLTISPHTNADLINELGSNLSKKYDIEYLVSNFKKKNGFLNSLKLSKKHNLYRQHYCGCKYSIYDN